MMAYAGSLLFGNAATQFDCRVCNALPAVENVWFQNRAGRACVEAARAGSTAIGYGNVIRQFKIGENAPKEKPRTRLLIDDTCVFSKPADARIFCMHALEQRTGIHVALRLVGRALLDPCCHLVQLLL